MTMSSTTPVVPLRRMMVVILVIIPSPTSVAAKPLPILVSSVRSMVVRASWTTEMLLRGRAATPMVVVAAVTLLFFEEEALEILNSLLNVLFSSIVLLSAKGR